MTNVIKRRGTTLAGLLATTLLAACGAAVLPGGGGQRVDPGACSGLDATDVGRKLHAFLSATARLQRTAADLEGTVKGACQAIGGELGASTQGSTREVCDAASAAVRENLAASISPGARIQTTYEPARCEANAQARASAAARCEGSAQGTTGTGGTSGSAEGACQAAAEVDASIEVECKPAVFEMTVQSNQVTDAARLARVKAALEKGMPQLLEATGRAKLLASAYVGWNRSAMELAGSADALARDFGQQAVCVSNQLAAAAGAAASIEVSVTVTVEASASIGGAASGSAG